MVNEKKGKGNMVDLAFFEYEKLKSKDPARAKRLGTRGPADIYGLQPFSDGTFGTKRIIVGHFRNGRLNYVEE